MLRVFLDGLMLGSILTFIFERHLYRLHDHIRKWFNDNRRSVFGHHFHHSAWGLILLIIAFFVLPFHQFAAAFLAGIGLGVIAVHTDSERRLVFFEAEKLKKTKNEN